MSNKLVKHQESKELLSGKQKEILFLQVWDSSGYRVYKQ